MRTSGVIAIGAVLLVTLAACGAPSASAAPSEMSPTVPAETLSPLPTPSIDGVALAEAAVAKLQGDPFVAHVEADIEATGADSGATAKSHMVADFDGDDLGIVLTSPDVPEIGLWVVGDDAWWRGVDGELTQVSPGQVALLAAGVIEEIRITDDARLLRYAGPETIDGRTVHRLTAAGTIPYSKGTWDALDLYVEPDGTPIRMTGTYTTKGDSGETLTGTTTMTFTSFGGPVTIEPPPGDAASPGAT